MRLLFIDNENAIKVNIRAFHFILIFENNNMPNNPPINAIIAPLVEEFSKIKIFSIIVIKINKLNRNLILLNNMLQIDINNKVIILRL